MMAGRMAIGMANFKPIRLAQWADEGERFLRENIPAKDLRFFTSWDTDKLTITLNVYRSSAVNPPKWAGPIFTVTEKAEAFVSQLTVTKILMIS